MRSPCLTGDQITDHIAPIRMVATKLGRSWYSEIEIDGRVFAAIGGSIRECAEQLAEKARAAGQ